MSNLFRPGFRWHSSLAGGGMPSPISCAVADEYDGDLGGENMHLAPGHPVKAVNTGTVAHAAAGDTIWGVVVGIEPHYDPALGAMKFSNFLPNQTPYGNDQRESRVLVVPVQGQRWRVQCDDNVTATTYAEYLNLRWNNADHIFASGSDPEGHCLLNIDGAGTSAAGWQIVDVPDRDFQDFSALYVELLVAANEGQLAPFSTSGV